MVYGARISKLLAYKKLLCFYYRKRIELITTKHEYKRKDSLVQEITLMTNTWSFCKKKG